MSDQHNHQQQIYHEDKHGYIAYCNGCDSFQLGFGNFFLNQSKEDFIGFADLITRYLHRHYDRKDFNTKDIYLDSPYPGLGLLFSRRDLERLDTMLQKTLLILEAGNAVRNQ